MELLEDRTQPSAFYDLTAVASTTDGFVGFGDMPAVNAHGTVAFVGFTDANSNGIRESGLWTRAIGGALVNVNPGFSDSEGRDFGRAVAINDKGVLTARDQIGTHFDVRSWDGTTTDADTILATTSPGAVTFGKYASLQTFTAINNHGDVAYIGSNGDFRTLEVHQHTQSALDSVRLDTFPVGPAGGPTPRPQLTDDGRVLARLSNGTITLFTPGGTLKNFASSKDGFTVTGAAPGITADGRVVAFVGDRGNGLGVFVAYYSGTTRHIVRVAGEGLDGWKGFDLNSAVRVSGMIATDRGVTVAFEGNHATLGHGIFTSRVSFFDDLGAANFSPDDIGAVRVNGAVPVALAGDTLKVGGPAITDLELYGINNRDRGDLAFWVKIGAQEAIVRATPQQVVYINFDPTQSSFYGSTANNLALLTTLGLQNGWGGSFDDALTSLGYTGSLSDRVTFRRDVVAAVQQRFTGVGAAVRVLSQVADNPPAVVPTTQTNEAGQPILSAGGLPVRLGAYTTVYVGAAPAAIRGPGQIVGLASPVDKELDYSELDYFNQFTDDSAVVLADNVFLSSAFSDGAGGVIPFADIPAAVRVRAVAATIAHEAGHDFGLYHTDAALSADLMHGGSNPGEYNSDQDFNLTGNPVQDSTGNGGLAGVRENSAARLIFDTGGPAELQRDPPNQTLLNLTGAPYLLYKLGVSLTGGPPTLARLVVGTVSPSGADLFPAFEDLGSGPTAALFTKTVRARPGAQMILIGSSDGTTADVIGIPVGQAGVENSLARSVIGVVGDARLRAPVGGNGPAFNLFQLTAGGPVQIGTVNVQGTPAVGLSADGATLTSGDSLFLGTTRLGGGALTRTIAVRNSGTGTVTLGTVSVTGAGYSVTQPGSTTLSPGASTTLTVTLSDATVGAGIAGTLTVPSNDPAGSFTQTLRGDVTTKPEVLAVTRLDNGTGPLVIAIDFSTRLQTGPAGTAANFVLVYGDGTLPLASAAYSEAGGVNRVTLTSAASGPFAPGRYEVRFDGASIRSLSGTPAATPADRLVVGVGSNSLVTVAPADGGGFRYVGTPESLGAGTPSWIDTADLTGDGLADLVTASPETSQVVIFPGRPEGGFDDPTFFSVDASTATRTSQPTRPVVADWNADGIPDLVVWDNEKETRAGSSIVYPRVLILLNDGHGHFAAAPDSPIPVADAGNVGVSPSWFLVGDFLPGPGLELAMVGPVRQPNPSQLPTDSSIQIIGKDPFLGYSRQALLWFGDFVGIEQIVAADFNGDGRVDLVSGNNSVTGNTTLPALFLGTATGFAAPVAVSYPWYDGWVATGDFTGDGRPDLAIVYDGFSNSSGIYGGGAVSVMTWDAAAGTLVATDYQFLNRRGVSVAGAADLNRDGKLDLLVRADAFWLAHPENYPDIQPTAENSVLPLYGRGDGTFTIGGLSPLAPSGDILRGNFVLRDVTGDGFPDALFGNTTGGRIGLLTNDTTGVLRSGTPSGPTTGSYRNSAPIDGNAYDSVQSTVLPEFQTADFNRDGLADLLRLTTGGLDVLLGRTDGGFALAHTVAFPVDTDLKRVLWSQIGDLNRDGVPDLLFGLSRYIRDLPMAQVYFGNGDGTFRVGPDVPVGEGDSGNGRGRLADVNRDGNLDLVFSLGAFAGTTTGYGVYFGDGAGHLNFNPNTVVSTSGSGTTVAENWAVADVTGDGVPDIVSTEINPQTGTPLTRVYVGRGNGTFAAAVESPLQSSRDDSRSPITFLDFNDDGRPDMARFDSNVVSWYANTGGGRFAYVGSATIPSYGTIYGPGLQVASLRAGDIDHDGKVDLAVALYRIGKQYDTTPWTQAVALRGNGAGGFTPEFFEVGADVPTTVVVVPADAWVSAGTVAPADPPAPPSPPAGQPLTVSTPQGAAVRVVPPSVPGIPQLIAVATPPAHGTVRLDDNGTPNNPGDDAFVYTPASGYVGSDTWTYVAGNAGGVATGTVAVTVTPGGTSPPPPNTPPTISDVADVTVPSGGSTGLIPLTVGDAQTAPAALAVTAVSSNHFLVPPSGIVLGGTGASRTATVTPAAGQLGTATVTLTVTDGGGLVVIDTFTVTVPPPARYVVSGYAYRDRDSDGTRDLGEGAPEAVVFIDANRSGVRDPGEAFTTPAADGFYTLDIPLAGMSWVTATHPGNTGPYSFGPIGLTPGGQGGEYHQDWGFPEVWFTQVNTPPAISDVPNQPPATGAAVGPVGFTVSDIETPATGLTVTGVASDTRLFVLVNGTGGTRTATILLPTGWTGTAVVTLTVRDAGGLAAADAFTITVPSGGTSPPPDPRPGVSRQFAAGADRGAGGVRFYNPDGSVRFATAPFGTAHVGGVRTAAADFNGDGVADVVAGTGPGGPTRVVVLDGVTQQVLFDTAPFEPAFIGGVYVAAGDVDGDGIADLVVTPDEGGGPRVQVYAGAGFGRLADFFGIDDPNFRGGARATLGDVNADGYADLVVSAGFGGGPRVAGYDGRALAGGGRVKLFGDFFLFEQALRNGAYVAVGDLDGDGFGDVVGGGGPGGGPRVYALSGADLLAGHDRVLANFFAGNTANRGGVRVAMKNLDGDAKADVVVGDGAGAGSRVTGYLGKDFGGGGAPELFGYDAFPGLTAGVFVG